MNKTLPGFLVVALLTLTACGGGGGGSAAVSPGTGGGTTNTGGAIVTPTVVTTAAGGVTSGVNIIVPTGASGLNVFVLGAVDPSSTTGSAFATGDVIPRGSSRIVLIFGTGLSATDDITFSGPGDITITGKKSITSTSGKPGIQFLATTDLNAALGARTLRIHNGNDIATFTGGLEVVQ